MHGYPSRSYFTTAVNHYHSNLFRCTSSVGSWKTALLPLFIISGSKAVARARWHAVSSVMLMKTTKDGLLPPPSTNYDIQVHKLRIKLMTHIS